MLLADLFSHRDHDASPADHRSQAESQRDGNFDPVGDKPRRLVHRALIVLESFAFTSVENRRLAFFHQADIVFLHQTNGLAGNIHVVADVGLVLRRDGLEDLVESYFVVRM